MKANYGPVAQREPTEMAAQPGKKLNSQTRAFRIAFAVTALGALAYLAFWLISTNLNSHSNQADSSPLDFSVFQLKLQGNLSEVANQTELAIDLEGAITNQLGVEPDQVIVLALTPGSIVVDVKVIGFPVPQFPLINVTTVDNITLLVPNTTVVLPVYPTAAELVSWFLERVKNATDPLHLESVFIQYPIIIPEPPAPPAVPLNLTYVYSVLQRDYANKSYVNTGQLSVLGYINATKQSLTDGFDAKLLTETQMLQDYIQQKHFANSSELDQVYVFIAKKQFVNQSELASAVAGLQAGQHSLSNYINATAQSLTDEFLAETQSLRAYIQQNTSELQASNTAMLQFVRDQSYANTTQIEQVYLFIASKQFTNQTELASAVAALQTFVEEQQSINSNQLQQWVKQQEYTNTTQLDQVYVFIVNQQFVNQSELASAVATLQAFIEEQQQWVKQQQYANTTTTDLLRSDLTELENSLPTEYVPRSEITSDYPTTSYLLSLNYVDHAFLDNALAMHPTQDYLDANFPTYTWIESNLHNATLLLVQELYVNRSTGQVISKDDGLHYEVYSSNFSHRWSASHNIDIMVLTSSGKLSVADTVTIRNGLQLNYDQVQGIQIKDVNNGGGVWLGQLNRQPGSVVSLHNVLDNVNGDITAQGTVTANRVVSTGSSTNTFNGAITTNGGITVTGAATLNGGVTVTGTVITSGDIATQGTVTGNGFYSATGTNTFNGPVTAKQGLTVMNGDIIVTNGALGITGDVVVNNGMLKVSQQDIRIISYEISPANLNSLAWFSDTMSLWTFTPFQQSGLGYNPTQDFLNLAYGGTTGNILSMRGDGGITTKHNVLDNTNGDITAQGAVTAHNVVSGSGSSTFDGPVQFNQPITSTGSTRLDSLNVINENGGTGNFYGNTVPFGAPTINSYSASLLTGGWKGGLTMNNNNDFVIHSDGSNAHFTAIELGSNGMDVYSKIYTGATTDITGLSKADIQQSLGFHIGSDGVVRTKNNILDDGTGKMGIGAAPLYLLHVHSTDTSTVTDIASFSSVASDSGVSTTRILLQKGSGYGGFIEGFLDQGVGAGLKLGFLNGGTGTPSLTLGSDSTVKTSRVTLDDGTGNMVLDSSIITDATNGAAINFLQNGLAKWQLVTYNHVSNTNSPDRDAISFWSNQNNIAPLTMFGNGDVTVGRNLITTGAAQIAGISLDQPLTSSSPRPALNTVAIESYEVAGMHSGDHAADDGFLRLRAGGGTLTNSQSYIDLSGFSTVPDMNSNIVIGAGGTEKVRIDSSGVAIKTALQVNGGIALESSLTSNSSRPGLITSIPSYEIAGMRSGAHVLDDGFLRLRAGGGTTPAVQSFIELSGYSDVPDMYQNIVLGAGGLERVRIDTAAMTVKTPLKLSSPTTPAATIASDNLLYIDPVTRVVKEGPNSVIHLTVASSTVVPANLLTLTVPNQDTSYEISGTFGTIAYQSGYLQILVNYTNFIAGTATAIPFQGIVVKAADGSGTSGSGYYLPLQAAGTLQLMQIHSTTIRCKANTDFSIITGGFGGTSDLTYSVFLTIRQVF